MYPWRVIAKNVHRDFILSLSFSPYFPLAQVIGWRGRKRGREKRTLNWGCTTEASGRRTRSGDLGKKRHSWEPLSQVLTYCQFYCSFYCSFYCPFQTVSSVLFMWRSLGNVLNSGFGSQRLVGMNLISSEPQAPRLSKALWGWISLVQNHKCCAQLCLYKLVMPEREVGVCFADEGQQTRNSCPELPIFFLSASHCLLLHALYKYRNEWVKC